MRGIKAAGRLLIAGAVFALIGKVIAPYILVLSLGMAALAIIGLIVIMAIGAFASR